MQNNKGFTLTEVMLGSLLLLLMMLTILPISIQLYKERQILNEEQLIMHVLYEEMKRSLLTNSYDEKKITHHSVRNTTFTIHYQKQDSFIKRCAKWINLRSEQKEVCFYAYP